MPVAHHPAASACVTKFSRAYSHRTIADGIGHNVPQEQAFAGAVLQARKDLGMMGINYLRDSLKAVGAEQVSTCKLCGALVSSSYQDAHNRGHG